MCPSFLLSLCMSLVVTGTEGSRVLIIPVPLLSHTKYQSNVARALSKLGHDVWLVMADYVAARKVLDTSSFTVLEFTTGAHIENLILSAFNDTFFRGENPDWAMYLKAVKDYTHSLLTNKTFFHMIRNIQPEFVIIDYLPHHTIMSIIPYRLRVPFAFLGSVYEPISQRIPFSPVITPSVLHSFSDRMTFSQKLVTTVSYLGRMLYNFHSEPDALTRYAPEMPHMAIDMLVARAELWLVEMDHILDYPNPTVPNVKLIGGTAITPAKPLSPPYKTFMDDAKQGVVIVSFGSYVLDLPTDIGDNILKVLMLLPFRSVFRSNLTSPNSEKILTATWIPQNDLLGHKNTRVFLTHCGKNGQYEALFHAVPLVAAPLFADQGYNAERVRSKGFGESVDIRTVTAEELRDTILKVAYSKRYKESISKASKIFQIEFGVPVERAAFWLDHVMKYGGAHMRSAGHDMPYYQFLGLDVFLFLVTAVCVVFVVIVGFVYAFLKCVLCGHKKKFD